MFGLSRAEKLKKDFDRNGVTVMGEVSSVGDNTMELILSALRGNECPEEPPLIAVSFRTPQGEDAEIYCRIPNKSYKVGDRVTIKYIKRDKEYIGYILTDKWESRS